MIIPEWIRESNLIEGMVKVHYAYKHRDAECLKT